jgi:hypothetical protein
MRAPVALATIAISALVGCVSPSTRRIHAENVAKAEAFEAMFDRDVRAGASFDEVLAYLQAHKLHFGAASLTIPQDEPPGDGYARREVEMFREKSPNWYCGEGSVGLSISFVDNKLKDTAATSWSMDCP